MKIWNSTYIVWGLNGINCTFYGSNHSGSIDSLKSGFIFVGFILNFTLSIQGHIWRQGIRIKLWSSRTQCSYLAVRFDFPLSALRFGLLSGVWSTNLGQRVFRMSHQLSNIAQGSTTRSQRCLTLCRSYFSLRGNLKSIRNWSSICVLYLNFSCCRRSRICLLFVRWILLIYYLKISQLKLSKNFAKRDIRSKNWFLIRWYTYVDLINVAYWELVV